ncbi:MAG: hypothetical protein WBP42_02485 [Candidatus Zixiibacteriota bacterium]
MTGRPKITYPYAGQQVQKCAKCEVMIFFHENPKTGKFIPINKETLEPHFADCPAAAQFRRPKV